MSSYKSAAWYKTAALTNYSLREALLATATPPTFNPRTVGSETMDRENVTAGCDSLLVPGSVLELGAQVRKQTFRRRGLRRSSPSGSQVLDNLGLLDLLLSLILRVVYG